MALRKLFLSPWGKIPRSKFILGHLGALFFFIVIALSWSLFMNYYLADTQSSEEYPLEMIFSFLLMAFFVLSLVYSCLCLYIKRLRDCGLSVWLAMLGLIPYVNLAMILFLFCSPSRENKHT